MGMSALNQFSQKISFPYFISTCILPILNILPTDKAVMSLGMICDIALFTVKITCSVAIRVLIIIAIRI